MHTSRIPINLRKLLKKQGYVMMPQFARALGVKYERALSMIPRRLGAIDVRSEGSTRPSYRLLEHHLEAFFADRDVQQIDKPKSKSKRRLVSCPDLLDG